MGPKLEGEAGAGARALGREAKWGWDLENVAWDGDGDRGGSKGLAWDEAGAGLGLTSGVSIQCHF